MKCKVEKIVGAYKVLDEAKYTKMDDADKVRLWKITRKLGPIAERFKEDSDDAEKKFMPRKDFITDVAKAIQYDKNVKDGNTDDLPLTKQEHDCIVSEWNNYQKLVGEALSELKQKEEEIDMEPISEDAFGKLMASNDWSLKEVNALDFIVE